MSAQPSTKSTKSERQHESLLVNEPAASREDPEVYLRNKATILSDIDTFLGYDGPPTIEYVFVENVLPDFGVRCAGVAFGHAAVRYTLPTGEQRVVNITRGGAGGVETETPLVQIYEDPADYLFGVNGQRGIFARSICLVRVHAWDEDSVLAMDHWFKGVAHAFQRENAEATAKVGFGHCGAMADTLRLILGFGETGITGNCSNWISQALVLGGVAKRLHTFPKAIVVDMLEHLLLDRRRQDKAGGQSPRVRIVYLERANEFRQPKPSRVRGLRWGAAVAPFYWLKTWLYWDLRRFADATVSIEARSAEAGGGVGAVIRPGAAYRPWWSREYSLARWFHSIVIFVICLAFTMDPLSWWAPVPEWASGVIARLFVVLVFLLLNAHWY